MYELTGKSILDGVRYYNPFFRTAYYLSVLHVCRAPLITWSQNFFSNFDIVKSQYDGVLSSMLTSDVFDVTSFISAVCVMFHLVHVP